MVSCVDVDEQEPSKGLKTSAELHDESGLGRRVGVRVQGSGFRV